MSDTDLLATINRNFPPSTQTLGTRLVTGDVDAGWIDMTFSMPERFCDRHGLNRGLITAMLDTSMANTVIYCSRISLSPPTLELKVSFFAACDSGDYRCRARFEYRGRSIAFLSASLYWISGELPDLEVARATSTVMLIPFRG